MNKGLVVGLVLGGVVLAGVGGAIWWVNNRKTVVPTVSTEQNVLQPLPTTAAELQPIAVPEVAGQIKEFTVEGSNFKHTPNTLKVKKGDTVRITFKSTQGFHDFVLDEFDVQTSQIGEGDEEEVEFVADKTGTFEYYCSVGQHRKNGMVGKLIVE